jgi:hypothetical protein
VSSEVVRPLRPGCETCDFEPMTDLPEEWRQRTLVWSLWQLHVAMHNAGRVILDEIRKLLRW